MILIRNQTEIENTSGMTPFVKSMFSLFEHFSWKALRDYGLIALRHLARNRVGDIVHAGPARSCQRGGDELFFRGPRRPRPVPRPLPAP